MAKLMDVLVKVPKSSNFNLSKKVRFSMAPGLLYPVYVKDVLAGDVVPMSMTGLIKSHATLAPLMGSFKLQFDRFFIPDRLYTPSLRGNRVVSAISCCWVCFHIKNLY